MFLSSVSENHIMNHDHQTPIWHHTSLNLSLKSTIFHEDPQSQHNVCTRFLHTNSLNTADVERCVDSLRLERSEDIAELERLADEALGKDVEDLEREEEEDRMEMEMQENGKGATEGEKLMYEPLVRIFNHISSFPFGGISIDFDAVDNLATGSSSHEPDTSNNAPNRNDEDTQPNDKNVENTKPHVDCNSASANPPPRIFRVTRGTLEPDTPQSSSISQAHPDISAISHFNTKHNYKHQRDCDVFIEVKPSAKQGPKSAIAKGATILPSLVTQSANYARLYLADRPFMLYSIGILIFGTYCCVGVFDRDGITFSPIYDMFGSDISILVRVIYSIPRLPIKQLGFDPTVEMLDPKIQQELEVSGSGDARNPCPSYLVTVSTTPDDRRRWCTIGPPVRSSTSLLGKGTTVWHAKEYNPSTKSLSGPQVILKTSWRHNLRPKESDIYRHVHTQFSLMRPNEAPDSKIAQWVCGGDVLFPATTFPISVDNLRHPERSRRAVDAPEYRNRKRKPTSTMHRLVLSSVGKSLTEYSSEKELLEAFRDALQGHKNLCDVGVLHRDISIGNIFIGENGGGFVADLDCAYIGSQNIVVPPAQSTAHARNMDIDGEPEVNVTHEEEQLILKIKRGIEITGTTQFMAFELLRQMERRDGVKIPHAVHHDVESFIWVLCYAVLTWLLKHIGDAEITLSKQKVEKEREGISKILSLAFSQTDPQAISDQRHADSLGIAFPESGRIPTAVKHLMSTHLIRLFSKLADLLERSNLCVSRIPLTHKAVLEVVNETLCRIDGNSMDVDQE